MCCTWTSDIFIDKGREHIGYFRATLSNGGMSFAAPGDKGILGYKHIPMRTRTLRVYAQCCGSYIMYLAEAHPRCAQVSPLGFERACPGVWKRKTESDGFSPCLTGTGGAKQIGCELPQEVAKHVPSDAPSPGRPKGSKDTDYLDNSLSRVICCFFCCGGNCQADNGFCLLLCPNCYPCTKYFTNCCFAKPLCMCLCCNKYKPAEPEWDLDQCPAGAQTFCGKTIEYIRDPKYLLPAPVQAVMQGEE